MGAMRKELGRISVIMMLRDEDHSLHLSYVVNKSDCKYPEQTQLKEIQKDVVFMRMPMRLC